MHKKLAAVGLMLLCVPGCREAHTGREASADVVGTWIVKIPDAPFPLHLFVFHSDGTVEQSNPDAGDPNTSDSNLMGAWRAEGSSYRGKLVEITADRTSRQFAARGEIAFTLKVSGNTFAGLATAMFFDPSEHRIRGPVQVEMQGERVLP
jgi:hypothetical protein